MSLQKYQNISLKKAREQGFTIVELLIVIIVIAILAALVISAYTGIQTQARDSQAQANAKSAKTAIMAFNAQKEAWPQTLADLNLSDNNVKLDTGTLNLTGSGGATAPTSSDAGKVQVKLCPTSGTKTGAIVAWYKIASPAGIQTENLGTIGTC